MNLSVEMTEAGVPSLKYGEEWLDDMKDPLAAAVAFAPLDRIEGKRRVVVFGTGLGYRLVHLKQSGIDNVVVYEPNQAIIDACKEFLPQALDGVPVFSDVSPFMSYLVQDYKADDETILLVPPAYRRAFPSEHERMVDSLRDAQGFVRIKENSIEERTLNMIESSLLNIPRLVHVPAAAACEKPLLGQTAFIVSAGPSLDNNGHLLTQAAKKGPIFTVNTAASAVKHTYGAEIDVLVSIEAIRNKEQMDKVSPRSLVLDISAHPSGYEVDAEAHLTMIQAHPVFAYLSQKTGIRPLACGASVSTAAVSLAFAWGASRIVLLGQDLAYTGGRGYAAGTGREHARVEALNDNVLKMDLGLDDLFESHGLKQPPKRQPRLSVQAWGGEGRVDTTYDHSMFRRWFEGVAHNMKERARFINATEGGSRIDGWEELRLEEVLREVPDRSDDLHQEFKELPIVPQDMVDDMREEIRETAIEVAKLADRTLRAKSKRQRDKLAQDTRLVARRAPMVDGHAAGQLVAIMKNEDIPKNKRFRQTFETIRDSAKRVVELVK